MMYTLDSLVRDCLGRTARATADEVLSNMLLSRDTYKMCWTALVRWLEKRMAAERAHSTRGTSFAIPHLGTIFYRVFNMGIKVPQFDLSDDFQQAYGVVQASPHSSFMASYSVQRPDMAALGSSCSPRVDAKTVTTALTTMIECLGEVMSDAKQEVMIEFGAIGHLACTGRLASFHFTQSQDTASNRTGTGKGRNMSTTAFKPTPVKDRQGIPMRGLLQLDATTPGNGQGPETQLQLPLLSPGFKRGAREAQASYPSGSVTARPDLVSYHATAPAAAAAASAAAAVAADEQQQHIYHTPSRSYGAGGAGMGAGAGAALGHSSLESSSVLQGLRSPHLAGKAPALLDEYARTRAAPLSSSNRPVADRIGALYTPSAALLTLSAATKSLVFLKAHDDPSANGGAGSGSNNSNSNSTTTSSSNNNSRKQTRTLMTSPLRGARASRDTSAGLQSPFSPSASSTTPRRPAAADSNRGRGRPGGRRAATDRLKPAGSASASAINVPPPRTTPIAGPPSPWIPTSEAGSDGCFLDPIAKARSTATTVSALDAYALSPRAAVVYTPKRSVPQELTASSLEWRRSLGRYWHYVNAGVDASMLPQMSSAWIENIVRLLPNTPVRLNNAGALTDMLTEVLVEVRGAYERSSCQAIVDYVLRSPEERERLGVTVLPSDLLPPDWGWGAGRLVPTAPADWHEAVAVARDTLEENLHVVHPALRALTWLWRDYQPERLVALPRTELAAMHAGWRPVTAAAFEEEQAAAREALSNKLTMEWYTRCVSIIGASTLARAGLEANNIPLPEPVGGIALVPGSAHDQGPGFASHARIHSRLWHNFYGCAAVLMSHQLRGTVEESIDDLLVFFQRYAVRQQRLELRDMILRHRAAARTAAAAKAEADAATAARKAKADADAAAEAAANADRKKGKRGAAGKKKEPASGEAPAAPAAVEPKRPSSAKQRSRPASRGHRMVEAQPEAVFTPDPLADGEMSLHSGAPYTGSYTAPCRPAFVVELSVELRADPTQLEHKGYDGGDSDSDSGSDSDADGAHAAPQPPPEKLVIACSPSAQEIMDCVERVFSATVETFHKIPRVEVKLHSTSVRGSRFLSAVSQAEPPIAAALQAIQSIVHCNMADVEAALELYTPFEYLLSEPDRLELLLRTEPDLETCAQLVARYGASVTACRKELKSQFSLDLILLDCTKLNDLLCERADELVQRVLSSVAHRYMSYNAALAKQFKTMAAQLAQKPHDSQGLVDAEAFLDAVRYEQLDQLEGSVDKGRRMLSFLFEHDYKVTVELMRPLETTVALMSRMDACISDAERMLFDERSRLEFTFSKSRDEFTQQLEALAEQVESFKERGDASALWANAEEVKNIQAALEVATQRALEMNEEEERLGWMSTAFTSVEATTRALQPFADLWELVVEHHRGSHDWVKKCVFNLDAEKVEEDVQRMLRTSMKLVKQLAAECPKAAAVSAQVQEKLEGFKKHLPLLHVVCNQALQKRHWTQMSEVVGFTIRPDKSTDLIKLVDIGMSDYINELEVISTAASQEWTIEKGLKTIADEWTPAEFEFKPFKESGTFVISGGSVDAIQELLDDHIIKVHAMRGSPYAKTFMRTIHDLEHFLESTQDILDMWVKLQSHWLYLAPIMTAPDIMRQMPSEGRSFAAVDATWRSIMRQGHNSPSCTQVVRIDNLLHSLTDAYNTLDVILSHLNAYLETKRLYFSRFFFLSNDELLEILAETRDPTRVQPHLKKCFEGIQKLEFQENLDITAMISTEGERVPLNTIVNPNAAEGAVEKWLLEIEESMKATTKQVLEAALQDYKRQPRVDWVLKWPGQVVLTGNGTYWTRDVEQALKSAGHAGVKELSTRLDAGLEDIVRLVRGDLSGLARKTLSAVVVLDVHARDVVKQLVTAGVSDPAAFEWISQLRYYWENESMWVKMISSVLEYAYEYIGNSGRLVITPLTDRCYRTLIGAVHLQYGGAPEGPAGTGKTETVKDLAKALARQCVVFNCSDQLDYKAMAKFFKGLASSGAWACFDEFNRIQLEVLSVIAQQITTIQQAIARQVSTFTFEGTEIQLKWTANVFITMNPGYAGRAELPDNLKVLFRSVAMMVPDYAMIAEIILYSMGYLEARELAGKIVATYRLCSEQLSSQSHYDYGMRAVMAVLRAAGNLKRKFPEAKEALLMLRAINEVNLPKFLDYDLPLFSGIISDLFPGLKDDDDAGAVLHAAIVDATKECNLQPTEYFVEKTVQTYEMMVVRHGFMIVGEELSGKSAALRTLRAALVNMHETKQMPNNINSEHELPADMHVVNPKSVPLSRLYGCFDPVTHEWTNGVLAVLFKRFATDASNPNRKWLVFDGPVDAVWIENINTVLDDNKKLCLMSGEIIAMSDTMSMLFETRDLKVASPATVSRCGMVYLEPHKLGWQPLVDSWLAAKPKGVRQVVTTIVGGLFHWVAQGATEFMAKSANLMLDVSPQAMIVSTMKMMDSLLPDLYASGGKQLVEELGDKPVMAWLESVFIFSLLWGVSGCADTEGRLAFSNWLRKAINGNLAPDVAKRTLALPLPLTGSMHLFEYVRPTSPGNLGLWMNWDARIAAAPAIPRAVDLSAVIVPTVDTARYTFMLQCAIKTGNHALFVGQTGTGKSAYVTKELHAMPHDKHSTALMAFSSQTTTEQTQGLIETFLSKRRKHELGPEVGKQQVLFVDDLNMPAVEEYGAQPPLELLRQFVDQGGWYAKDISFTHIVETILIGAMQPPGGGRNGISPRLSRHLLVFGMAPGSDATITRIFSTLLGWHFASKNFTSAMSEMAVPLVTATLQVYKICIDKLLPTPAKSHYMFNLRDYSRVMQGLMLVDSKVMGEDKNKMMRLWTHEVMRVFSDRLINDEDRDWFCHSVRDVLQNVFRRSFDELFKHLDIDGDGHIDSHKEIRGLMFGNFMSPGAIPKLYDEVPVSSHDIESLSTSVERNTGDEQGTEPSKLHAVMLEALSEYNLTSTKPMDLVMFMFAIEHTARISRILQMPGGHALLIGVGGSGRRSLTRLAAFMGEYQLFQIEVTQNYSVVEWREDLKKILMASGCQGKDTVFLFSDTQIKFDSFIEDLNNILNTGDVPNLFEVEELTSIVEQMRTAVKAANLPISTPAEHYAFFKQRVKRHLHVVLCFSPTGASLRTRLRAYPSLVNCCSVDWFSEWPADALLSVARKFLNGIEMEPELLPAAVTMCTKIHNSVAELGTRFLNELRRHYYVTPTSYLELITTFKSLLDVKRSEVAASRTRYAVGLQKLAETENSVQGMKISLKEMQPVLERSSQETEEMMKVVDKETNEASAIRENVAGEEAIANAKASEARAIKEDCERDLAKALPALKAAMHALRVLKKSDIVEVKSMKSPPQGVVLVMEAVCIMMEVKPVKKTENGVSIMDYWDAAKRTLLNDSKFLSNLMDYDKDNIDPKIIKKVLPYYNNPDMAPNLIKKASLACHGLCCWVRAMVDYYHVKRVVAPKEASLKESQAEYEHVMTGLRAKQAELARVEAHLAELGRQLQGCVQRKADLERQMNNTATKLERAGTLLGQLSGEAVRWEAEKLRLDSRLQTLPGDVLLSSAAVAYLGAFTSQFRQDAMNEWQLVAIEAGMPTSEAVSLVDILGDPVAIRAWHIAGLPVDAFSDQNGVIVSNARRWPLLIDPQGQANKWVRNMEADNDLLSLKPTDSDMMRRMEMALRMGKPVLLENVAESLDSALEPLLLRQVFKKGGILSIAFGDSTVEYNNNFRLYMTCKQPNPHFLPDVSVKVTLINFMITPDGLSDQLLGWVVRTEQPDLEEARNQLIIQSADNKRQLSEIEDRILEIMRTSKGNILDDGSAIEALTKSKVISNEIAEKQAIAEQTEAKINDARMQYQPVARAASVLFFCTADMGNIDPMYQYSLEWFVNIFLASMANSPQQATIGERVQAIQDHFTLSLYNNVSRSLFVEHKLLFCVLVAVKLLQAQDPGCVPQTLWRFLLTGGTATEEPPENRAAGWLSDAAWGEATRLSGSSRSLAGLAGDFVESSSAWMEWRTSETPHTTPLPGDWNGKCSEFEIICVMRAICPHKVVAALQDFVSHHLSPEFSEPPAFDIGASFEDSSPTTPLIFILSPGSDPTNSLTKFAERKNMKLKTLSLGQGQGPIAEQMISRAVREGSWLLLQNCHLYESWMPRLESIVEKTAIANDTHPNYRLWLTSYPSPAFPIAVLQNGVKMTNEPPTGLRGNMLSSYAADPISDTEFFYGCSNDVPFKKLLFGLAFFHAIVQERRQYGPLGWNIAYQFSESDLRISVRQLHLFVDEADDVDTIPMKTLLYLVGECNYGGRVTDSHDRRCLLAILEQYVNADVAGVPGHSLSPSGQYTVVDGATDYKSCIDHIRSLPPANNPEVFGLHANATITKDVNAAYSLFDALTMTQPRAGGGGGDADRIVDEMASSLLSKLPALFDLDAAGKQYPVVYEDSMNTVLVQEMQRYNVLLSTITTSLTDVQAAIRGRIVMNESLEGVLSAVYNNQVPGLWAGSSYPSTKALGGYVADLVLRLQFLQDWMDSGAPSVFWLSGFYFTQSFLTAALQNYARKFQVPIDELLFTFQALPEDAATDEAPENGVYVNGLFLEGAKWDSTGMQLQECKPGELYSAAPALHLLPCAAVDAVFPQHYDCPVYKTPARWGTLSTTGHSTNFVMTIKLPTAKSQSHWTLRGCAALTQLST